MILLTGNATAPTQTNTPTHVGAARPLTSIPPNINRLNGNNGPDQNNNTPDSTGCSANLSSATSRGTANAASKKSRPPNNAPENAPASMTNIQTETTEGAHLASGSRSPTSPYAHTIVPTATSIPPVTPYFPPTQKNVDTANTTGPSTSAAPVSRDGSAGFVSIAAEPDTTETAAAKKYRQVAAA